jgi:DNA-binding transcriptional LysR family regulator
MKARQVELFRAVMLTRSVTLAAAQLRTSQPTASRMLSELEREIGFRLFSRFGNRLVPTADAVALYEEVHRSFVGLDRIAATAQGIAAFREDRLRIASIPSLALGPLAVAVPRFLRAHPDAAITLELHAFDEVVAQIATRRCDLGFVAHTIDNPGIRTLPVAEVEAVCVLPPGHPLARRRVIRVGDVAGARFVSLEGPSRRRIDEVFARHGVERRLLVETQTGAVACRLVREGAGVSILDPYTAAAMGGDGLVIRPFEPRVPFVFSAGMRATDEPARIVQAFLKTLDDYLSGSASVEQDGSPAASSPAGAEPQRRRRREADQHRRQHGL